jgi:hypothetical protein
LESARYPSPLTGGQKLTGSNFHVHRVSAAQGCRHVQCPIVWSVCSTCREAGVIVLTEESRDNTPEPSVGKSVAQSDYVELFGKVIGLGAATLPAIGFGVRYLALRLGPAPGPSGALALATPLGTLLLTGFEALSPALFFSALTVLVARLRWKPKLLKRPHLRRGKDRKVAFALMTVATVAFLLLLVTAPFPSGGLAFIAGVGTGGVFMSFVGGSYPISRLWFPTLILAATTTLGAGLSGGLVGVTTGYYRFTPEVRLQDGWYVQLGESGNTIYLYSCAKPSSGTLALEDNSVQTITFSQAAPSRPPSLLAVAVGGEPLRLGLQDRCPP